MLEACDKWWSDHGHNYTHYSAKASFNEWSGPPPAYNEENIKESMQWNYNQYMNSSYMTLTAIPRGLSAEDLETKFDFINPLNDPFFRNCSL